MNTCKHTYSDMVRTKGRGGRGGHGVNNVALCRCAGLRRGPRGLLHLALHWFRHDCPLVLGLPFFPVLGSLFFLVLGLPGAPAPSTWSCFVRALYMRWCAPMVWGSDGFLYCLYEAAMAWGRVSLSSSCLVSLASLALSLSLPRSFALWV